MGTKIMRLLVLALLLLSCDPASTRKFFIENVTSTDFKVKLYDYQVNIDTLDLYQNNTLLFYEFIAVGGGV